MNLCGNIILSQSFQNFNTFPENPPPEDAERQIGEGCTVTYVAVDGKFAGYLALSDTLRKESAATTTALSGLGVEPVLLTGDHENAARTIAGQLRIREVRANCLPEDSLIALPFAALFEDNVDVRIVGQDALDGVGTDDGVIAAEDAEEDREVALAAHGLDEVLALDEAGLLRVGGDIDVGLVEITGDADQRDLILVAELAVERAAAAAGVDDDADDGVDAVFTHGLDLGELLAGVVLRVGDEQVDAVLFAVALGTVHAVDIEGVGAAVDTVRDAHFLVGRGGFGISIR